MRELSFCYDPYGIRAPQEYFLASPRAPMRTGNFRTNLNFDYQSAALVVWVCAMGSLHRKNDNKKTPAYARVVLL